MRRAACAPARALAAAARSLARAPGRSLALLSLTCAGFLAVTMARAGYADMFERVRASMVEAEGDFSLSPPKGRSGMSLREYRSLKARLLSGGRFSSIRSSVPVDGLVGLGEKSAPASGLAIEGSGLGFDAAGGRIEARMGEALARTIGAEPGDELTALLGNRGFCLALAATARTEAAMLDRFYVMLPLEALGDDDASWRVDRLRFRLADPGDAVIDAIGDLRALPELSGYEASAYELGNTYANSVVDVYEESFRVVLAAVAMALLLALGNASLISAWERSSEWGTMLALGARFSGVASELALEAALLAAAAGAAGSLLTLVLSAAANLGGGLAFPPPPTQNEPLIVRFKPEASALAFAFGMSMACAVVSAFAASLAVKRRTVVELLFERN